MRFFRATALLAILFALYPTVVFAAPISIKNQTVLTNDIVTNETKLLEATVNLYCRVKVGNKLISITGSGVMIDPRGVILTNAHVAQYFLLNGEDSKLATDCSVRTGSPAKETYTAEMLYISKDWLKANTKKSTRESAKSTGESDFALLYVTDTKGPVQHAFFPLGIATQIKKGEEVTVTGYPAGDLNYKEIRNKLKVQAATTTITGLQTFESKTIDQLVLSRSKVASSGVSGGPVASLDAVVGIAVARSMSKTKEGASLRALTIRYIDQVVTNETGLSLITLFSGDLATLAAKTQASISTKTLSFIEKSLRSAR